jgi:hypothetical protein
MCLFEAILSLATGPFGKYQQLTDIICDPVLYLPGILRPERNFKMKARNSQVSESICPFRIFWLYEKMFVLKTHNKTFSRKQNARHLGFGC